MLQVLYEKVGMQNGTNTTGRLPATAATSRPCSRRKHAKSARPTPKENAKYARRRKRMQPSRSPWVASQPFTSGKLSRPDVCWKSHTSANGTSPRANRYGSAR